VLPLDDHPRGLGKMIRVAAEELDADGALGLVKFQVLEGAGVAAEDALRGDELRDDDIGSLLLAELAKNGVRDPGHGREVKREPVLEPGQHGTGQFTLLQQGRHLVLHGFDLVHAEVGIGDDEDFAGFDVLVNERATVNIFLDLDLLEEAFAL